MWCIFPDSITYLQDLESIHDFQKSDMHAAWSLFQNNLPNF